MLYCLRCMDGSRDVGVFYTISGQFDIDLISKIIVS